MTNDSDKARSEKKSETLEVRLPFSVKRAFMKATHRKGETASEVVRTFIDQYLEEARQANRKSTLQEMMMTIDHNRKKTAVILTGFAAVAFTFTAFPTAADDGVFFRLDKNGDGVIALGEIGSQDEAIIEALDKDGSGDVTIDEFQSKATVVKVDSTGTKSLPDGEVRIIEIEKTSFDLSDPKKIEVAIGKALAETSLSLTEDEHQAFVDEMLEELESHE